MSDIIYVEIAKDGSKFYYKNNNLHRVDGPAIEYSDQDKEWWYNGKRMDCTTQAEFEKLVNLKGFW